MHGVLLHCIRFRMPRLAMGARLMANKKGGVGEVVYSNQYRVSPSSAHTSWSEHCRLELLVRQCVISQADGWHCWRNVGGGGRQAKLLASSG